MRWTRGSTTSPAPESAAAVLLAVSDVSLLDEAGQQDVLAGLVGLLDAGRAVQVRHERRHVAVDAAGRSAEAVLTRTLAAEATVWPTQIIGGDAGDATVDDADLSEVVGVRREHRTCVELDDATWSRTFVLSRWPAQVPLGWSRDAAAGGLPRNPAGQAVLANTATKLLLGCEDHDRAAVAAGLGLTDAEAALLRAGRRGRGLLLTPSLRAAVRVVAHPAEHELASAGPRSR